MDWGTAKVIETGRSKRLVWAGEEGHLNKRCCGYCVEGITPGAPGGKDSDLPPGA